MSRWPTQALSELVDPKRGISYGIVQPGSHNSDGVPIVRVSNLVDGRIQADEVLRVSEEIERRYARTRLRGSEVLLSLVGSLGECAVVPAQLKGWNVARAVAVIPPRTDIDPRWIAFCLRTPAVRHAIDTWATTTVQATLNLRDVARLPIPMPDQPTRARIVDILGTLDDKIELNRRMNATLEEMARALFKSWFVDFDPVRANIARRSGGGGNPDLSGMDARLRGQDVFGLDSGTAALFPDSFQDSVIGPIPKGWRVGRVEELARLRRDTVDPRHTPEAVFRHFSIPSFDAGREPVTEIGNTIQSTKFAIPTEGAVLLSKLNPTIPRAWLVEGPVGTNALCSTEFLVTAPREGFSLSYMYSQVSEEGFLRDFAARARGTTGSRQRAAPADFLAMPVLVPPAAVAGLFTHVAAPLLTLCARYQAESALLAQTRDALLPRLLSQGSRTLPGSSRC